MNTKNQQYFVQESKFTSRITEFTTQTIPHSGQRAMRSSRFERKNSNNKFMRSIDSKQKYSRSKSNESMSNFYVKKDFIKSSTPQKFVENQQHKLLGRINCQLKSNKIQKSLIRANLVKNKQNCQSINQAQQNIKIQTQNSLDLNSRISYNNQKDLFKQGQTLINVGEKKTYGQDEVNLLLKKIIFYKEKCQKLSSQVKFITQQDDKQLECKGNKNNQKFMIKNQCCKILDNKLKSLSDQFQFTQNQISYLKAQNISLKLAVSKLSQNSQRLQQKQRFLESLLKQCQNNLTLQKQESSKKSIEISQILRNHNEQIKQTIKVKQKQIQNYKHKYNQLLKVVRGDKKISTKDTLKNSRGSKQSPPIQKQQIVSRKNHMIQPLIPCVHVKYQQHQHLSKNKFLNIQQKSHSKRGIKISDQRKQKTQSSNSDTFLMDLTPQKQ